MQELAGLCRECKKEIYCMEGFLTGVLTEDQTLLCFICSDKAQSTCGDDAAPRE
ncbi:hypothetical protein HQN90_16395 [Paenibacillus alba]|uniref:hypothetical protein n=1 Tax=Paenibacillus alba TaxID=1197127 RepID=UPI0015674501|nr:hypothetical protein [Paenibacillus alba]NQX67701.1 hypothetical protein [Paenibacillus alba]